MARESRARIHYGVVVLGMATVCVMGALGFGRFGYTSILPSMQEALGLSNTETGLLATWNATGYLVTALFAGALASRLGPRAVIACAAVLAGACMVLTGLAQGFRSAAVLRGLTGIASAGMNVPVMGLLPAWFAARRRGMATGVAVSGSSLGLMITGPLVPVVISASGPEGWRMSWGALGALTLLIALASGWLLRNRPEEKGLEPFGGGPAGTPPTAATARASSLAWGLVYRSRALWHLAAVYFLFGFSYFIYATYFVKYLVQEGGLARGAAGNLLGLVGMLSVGSGLLWGTVSDRWGRKMGLFGVFALQGLAFLTFALWRRPAGYHASALLFAMTAWSIPAIMAAACGDYLGPRLAPAALGLVTFVFGLGQAAGPGVAGLLADRTGSFAPAFLLASGAAFVGALGSLVLKPPGKAQ
jgi:predicted MFS family arabinose efflux permease